MGACSSEREREIEYDVAKKGNQIRGSIFARSFSPLGTFSFHRAADRFPWRVNIGGGEKPNDNAKIRASRRLDFWTFCSPNQHF